MKFDWKSTLRTVAPALGTALGGPMVGLAVRTVSETLLGKPDATEDEIAAAMQGATPDQMLALQQADYAFKAHMAELNVDLERIGQADRESAREFATKTSFLPQVVLSTLYIGGYFWVLYLFMQGEIDIGPEYIGTFKGLLGALTTPNFMILSYWFGSTRGSAEKTALLAGK